MAGALLTGGLTLFALGGFLGYQNTRTNLKRQAAAAQRDGELARISAQINDTNITIQKRAALRRSALTFRAALGTTRATTAEQGFTGVSARDKEASLASAAALEEQAIKTSSAQQRLSNEQRLFSTIEQLQRGVPADPGMALFSSVLSGGSSGLNLAVSLDRLAQANKNK